MLSKLEPREQMPIYIGLMQMPFGLIFQEG
jgi:hypothetical protein